MRFKTVKRLSKYLSNIAEQDVIFKQSGRWVYSEHDFSASEKKDALNREKGISAILVTSHNRKIDEVLSLLRVYMPETNIGFSVQDEIIKTCSHNGISINTESR